MSVTGILGKKIGMTQVFRPDGQAVPVGVGIPTLKVDRLTVGGTARKDPGGFMQ